MNRNHPQTWVDDQENENMIPTTGEDDFANFLDMGMDFPEFGGIESGTSLNTPMNGLGLEPNDIEAAMNAAMSQDAPMSMSQSHAQDVSFMSSRNEAMHMSNSNFSQHMYQHQMSQIQNGGQRIHHQVMVPPTPGSSEMQGGAAVRFYHGGDGLDQMQYDRGQVGTFAHVPRISPDTHRFPSLL